MTNLEERDIRDAGREPIDLDEVALWAEEDSLEEIAKSDPLWARYLDGDR